MVEKQLRENDVEPWYKQFWPWFLFSLPASVVVAGIVTLFIAIEHDDGLVADNYYKAGLAINQSRAQDQLAVDMNLVAAVTIDEVSGEVLIEVGSKDEATVNDFPDQLVLKWIHPINAEKDFTTLLNRNSLGVYIGQLDMAVSGRWYMQLTAILEPIWRIKEEINFSLLASQQFMMKAKN